MTIDFTIKATDLLTVFAALLSPLVAIQVTEWIRRGQESRSRKLHVFRTLMSTRAEKLAPNHVEALNLIDIEFDARRPKEKKVVEAWKLYHSHLSDPNYPQETWAVRQTELLVELLYEMALYLGYEFDKAHIKRSAYFPRGHGEIEEEQHRLRKAILGAFAGGALKVQAAQHSNQSNG